MYIRLSNQAIKDTLDYRLIIDIMESSVWNSGKRRRRFNDEFTLTERKKISAIHQQAYDWYLVSGVPDSIKITAETLNLWQRLAKFCYDLGER